MDGSIAQIPSDAAEAPKPSHWAVLVEIVQTLVLAALFYLLVSLTTARVVVDGPSMRPTLASGEWIVINRLAYKVGNPQRGDIIVFLPPTFSQTDDLIKRIVGLPGEKVEIREGRILINGDALSEPYARGATVPDGSWQLGADQVFVLGDNRQLSMDSRSFGPISLDGVVGKTLVIYWPPSEWGPVEWRNEGATTLSAGTG